MAKYLIFIIGMLCFTSTALNAAMPTYPDDEQFDHCLRLTNDIDNCAKDESVRHLNTVKQEYKSILGNPEILKWHKNITDSTTIMRDMYESWTAFRNRLCSLSNKASAYIAPLVSENISCNLYYILHHEDHLSSILLLMKHQAPQNRNEFGFLNIEEHDKDFEICITKKQYSQCIDEELVRSTQDIKNLYKTFIEDNVVGKWNNGNGLKSGNYRDMYDSWIAYRNRICSLAVWAYQKQYGQNSIALNQCIQYYNREKIEAMENLLFVAHSFLDEENIADDDDGGEAEGKTIVPLRKRPSVELREGEEFDTLKDEKIEETQTIQEDTSSAGKSIPSWAN